MLTENTVFYCPAVLAWYLPLLEKHMSLQSDQAPRSTTNTPCYSKHLCLCTLYSLCPECPHPSLTLATHVRFGLQIFFSRKPFWALTPSSGLPQNSVHASLIEPHFILMPSHVSFVARFGCRHQGQGLGHPWITIIWHLLAHRWYFTGSLLNTWDVSLYIWLEIKGYNYKTINMIRQSTHKSQSCSLFVYILSNN